MDEVNKQSWLHCRTPGCWKKRCEIDGQKLLWCGIRCRDKDPAWIYAPNCPQCGRKCSPSNWHGTHYFNVCGQCVEPTEILFYSNDKPYYEFTNFYRCSRPITVAIGGEVVHSHYSETLYQAAKIWFFVGRHNDNFWNILQMGPREAFNYVHGLNLEGQYPARARAFHGVEKIACMEMIVEAKFRDPDLGKLLVRTQGLKLIEDSPTDSFWGIGNGSGRNELGRVLMRVRDKISKN